jgi:hypothetical protein
MTWHRRFAHTSAKRCDYAGGLAERSAAEKPDYRHRSLLRARRKRPRHRGAADQRDELASPHMHTQAQGQHCIGSNEHFDRG